MKHLKHARFLNYVKTLIVLLAVIIISTACGGTPSGTIETPDEAKVTESIESVESGESIESEEDAEQKESVKIEELADKTISIIDMVGREIKLNTPVDRIVALTASDCEIIYALGAGDKLVGRGLYCDYPDEVLDIQTVESGSGTNLEQIIALEPQVVLMNKMAQEKEHADELENAGIAVIVSDAVDIEGVYESIKLIGEITGKATEAEALVNDMKQTFDELSAKAEADEKTVYFEVSPLEWGLWTAGKGTYMDEIAGIIGISNAFADVEGWAEISEEQVISRDPDYIVTIAMYFCEGLEPVEEITSRIGWGDIKAVKNGNVFLMNADEMSRPGPRLIEAAKMLYSNIYE